MSRLHILTLLLQFNFNFSENTDHVAKQDKPAPLFAMENSYILSEPNIWHIV